MPAQAGAHPNYSGDPLFQHAHIPMLLLDQHGMIQAANAAMQQLLANHPDLPSELYGYTLFNLLDTYSAALVAPVFIRADAPPNPQPLRLSVQLGGGEMPRQPCELLLSPLASTPLQWMAILTVSHAPLVHPLAQQQPTPFATTPTPPDIALLMFDTTLRYTMAEGTILAWGSVSKAQIVGRRLYDVFQPATIAQLEPLYLEAIAGTPTQATRRFGERSYLVYVLPIRDQHGHIIGGIDLTFHVSSATDLREALTQRTNEYRVLLRAVEQSSSSILVTNTASEISYVNEKFCEVTGYTREEVIGKNPRILKSGETADIDYQRMWQALVSGGRWQGEFHNRRKDGSLFWALASISAVTDEHGTITHYLAVEEDITSRKEMEEHLIKSLALLQATLESTSDGLLVLNHDGSIITSNQRMQEIWQLPAGWHEHYTASMILEHMGTAIVDQATFAEQIAGLNQHLERSASGLFQLTNGQLLEYTATPYVIAGTTIGRVWNFRDVTAQRQAEISLRESEALLSSIITMMDVGLNLCDEHGIFRVVNPAYCRLIGYTEEELIGNNFTMVLPEENRAYAAQIYQESIEGIHHPPAEWELRRKDGSAITVLASFSTMQHNDGRISKISALTDITQRKADEQALRASEERYQTLARQNARLFAAARRRADEAETLYEASTVITASLDQSETLNRILEQLARVVPHDSASVQIRDGDDSVIIAVRGFSYPDAVIGTRIAIAHAPMNEMVYAGHKPQIINDTHHVQGFTQPPNSNIRSWMGLPLIVRSEVIGMITLDHHTAGYFTDQHGLVGMAFATQVAIALQNVRMFERMQQLATTDSLTGLWTRGHFFENAYRAYAACLAEQQDISVILMDIDNFKWVNDTFGHIAGDEVLRVVAQQGRATLRESDLIGRYGGEEIVILLPNTNAQVSYRIAERLRVSLIRTMISTEQGTLALTASYGVATRNPNDAEPPDLEELIDRADRALGAAKRGGKNRVVAWHSDIVLPEARPISGVTQATFQRRAEAILRLSTRLNTDLEMPHLLHTICKETLRAIRVNTASIHLYNPERGVLEIAEVAGLSPKFIEEACPLTLELFQQLYRKAPVVIIPDLLDLPDLPNYNLYRKYDLRTFAGASMYHGGELVGVIAIGTRNIVHSFTPDEIELLRVLGEQAALAISNARLFSDLRAAYTATLEGWARAVDLRDHDTAAHSHRVTEMTVLLAQEMGITEPELTHVRRGALLHDVGKLGVPDSILLKQGKLDDKEWVIMRQHPRYAFDLLSPVEFLRPALDIPHYHHERWDGSGYPYGLRGTDIPLPARIFAVVDVWDALRFDRPYRRAWAEKDVHDYLQEKAGTLFDPDVVEAFFRVLERYDTEQFRHE